MHHKQQGDDHFGELIAQLSAIALEQGLSDEFRGRAKELARTLRPTNVAQLCRYLHSPPKEPSGYDVKRHGLGGWLSTCQFSIFELVYNLGPETLPFIRQVAWGEYDWTQGNAIELLIRFAADGIQTDQIVEEIFREFPKVRHEAAHYAVEPLIPELERSTNLKKLFERLLKCPEFEEACGELTASRGGK